MEEDKQKPVQADGYYDESESDDFNLEDIDFVTKDDETDLDDGAEKEE